MLPLGPNLGSLMIITTSYYLQTWKYIPVEIANLNVLNYMHYGICVKQVKKGICRHQS